MGLRFSDSQPQHVRHPNGWLMHTKAKQPRQCTVHVGATHLARLSEERQYREMADCFPHSCAQSAGGGPGKGRARFGKVK